MRSSRGDAKLLFPNRDTRKQVFIPKERNFIESESITIYNRWGGEVFNGDLFVGWNGRQNKNSSESLAGVHYYTVQYVDKNQQDHAVKGTITLAK